MDMIIKDTEINKMSFKTLEKLTDFVNSNDCERLILYDAIHVSSNKKRYCCDPIIAKNIDINLHSKCIETTLTMTKLKKIFNSHIFDDSNYDNEYLLLIKNAILETINKNFNNSMSENQEILFEKPFEFEAQTDNERDYGWEYYRDMIVKQGNQWGDTRPFYFIGLIVEDYYKRSWQRNFTKDEGEPQYGIFKTLNTIKKDGKVERKRVRNINFDLQNRKNKEIGDLGELIILDYEREYLIKAGKPQLAKKVILTKETLGNTAPYDILSYTKDGKEKYIEVKTTTKAFSEPFFLSANERKKAKAKGDSYYLYRIFNLNKNTGTYELIIVDDLLSIGKFEIYQYKVTIDTEI